MRPWPPNEGRNGPRAGARGRWRSRMAALGLLLGPACAAAERGNEPAASDLTSGQLLTRYRGRFTDDESDHDVAQTLDVALADPDGRWSGALLARANWDVDGTDPDSDFFDLA